MSARGRPGRVLLGLLALATGISFLLVVHNYGLDILPDRRVPIPAAAILPYSEAGTFGYATAFTASEPDRWPSMRSRVEFFEDGHAYPLKVHNVDRVYLVGGACFAHLPGRVVFSATDNSDPRTNGRSYSLTTPVLYRPAVGVTAMLVFLACVVAWYGLAGASARVGVSPRGVPLWKWHLLGASALFLLGLYLNTGTLAPYANTCAPMVVTPGNGYPYNQDNPHFRVLFDFVDGRDRSVWDHAILLRRILFPVLGWPLMKVFGFEIGGTLTSLALNVAAFVAALVLMRRWIGERAAVFAGWILALYPGAAYWAGMPYSYALIFPGSLLLMMGVWRLASGIAGWRLAALSLAMGIVYLGYDLAAFYVPATVIVLAWRRRLGAAAVSAVLQMIPQACWIFALGHVFGQSLENNNSGIYRSVILSYLHPGDLAGWWEQATRAPGYGFDVFFAANFIFLPALFLFVLAVNPLTSRARFHVAELALLAAALGLFLAVNLPPSPGGGWVMSGTWISRLYQPGFPALVLFMARWWQGLPALTATRRALVTCALAGASVGNALVVFGPVLDNPGRLSEAAFYGFYDHTDAHFIYESTLATLGRRPLGFARPGASEVATVRSITEIQAQLASARSTLAGLRQTVASNRAALVANQAECRKVGRALAEELSTLNAVRLDVRVRRGEITAEQARAQAKGWQEYVSPSLRALLEGPVTPVPASPPEPTAWVQVDMQAAISAESAELVGLQHEILQTQDGLRTAISDLAAARDELGRAQREEAAARRP